MSAEARRRSSDIIFLHMNPLRKLAGQILTIGIEGQDTSSESRSLLSATQPGGVIFFQPNIASEQQFAALVSQIRELLPNSHPYLALDLEGGLVDRFRNLIGPLPSVQRAAQAGLAMELGEMAGRELAAFSLNVDFAPVIDLGPDESKEIMGTRTAGAVPSRVVAFAREFLEGLAKFGILGCGKHFPGLGGGTIDSHLGMPTIVKNLSALWDQDLLPYRELSGQLPMVMVAHAWYPEVERELCGTTSPRPATLSPAIINQLLRERIGYEGLIVCDDLEMGGALVGRSIEEAGVGAIRAGCDILLVCHNAANVEKVHAALVIEAERSTEFRGLIEKAAARITAAKMRHMEIATPAKSAERDLNDLRNRLQQLTDLIDKRISDSSQRPAITGK